jgi:hypothetical protein
MKIPGASVDFVACVINNPTTDCFAANEVLLLLLLLIIIISLESSA